MSYQIQGPSNPQPCKKGCGRNIHFNQSNPIGFINGRFRPLEYIQTPQGMIEVQHNCPMNPQVVPQQVAQQIAAPPIPAGAGVKSVTEMLLDEMKKMVVLLNTIASTTTEQLNLLKALHPGLTSPEPQSEIAAAEAAGLPPEYQPADEIEGPPA